jgi:FkbM family methyltransferase
VTVIGDARNVVKFVWTHPANQEEKVRALLRAAGFQARARVLGQRTLAPLGSGSSIWADLHRTAAAKVVYANPPDYPEMIAWKRALRPGDLFVDVGANVGSYAIWAGDLGAEVIALEPAQDTFRLLAENVALNRHPITAIRAAAGAAGGTARFTSGLDSVNRIDTAGSVRATVVTIDSVVGNRVVGGMKVDVEGFEKFVLEGAANLIAGRRIGIIQLEINEHNVISGFNIFTLRKMLPGYGIYRLLPNGLVPVATRSQPYIAANDIPRYANLIAVRDDLTLPH